MILFLYFYAQCGFLRYVVKLKIKTKRGIKKIIFDYNYISKSIDISEDLWSLSQ